MNELKGDLQGSSSNPASERLMYGQVVLFGGQRFLPKEPGHQCRVPHDGANSILQLICFLAQLPAHWHFWPPLQPSHGPPVCRNATACQRWRSVAVTSNTGAIATTLKGVTRWTGERTTWRSRLSRGGPLRVPLLPPSGQDLIRGSTGTQAHWRSNVMQHGHLHYHRRY